MIEKGARVGIVGAGAMGTEIAFCFALAGFEVLVWDNEKEKLENLVLRSASIYDKGVGRGVYEAEQKASVLGAITRAEHVGKLKDCGLVTEAVFENEDVKSAVLRELDGICDARCIIATNTSTIPISVLSSYVSRSGVPFSIGTHYFSPASRMQLVEVVPEVATAPSAVGVVASDHAAAEQAAYREVKDVPGFAVNRMLHVFLIEAVRLVGGSRYAGGYRSRLPTRPRTSDGAFSIDGRHDIESVS